MNDVHVFLRRSDAALAFLLEAVKDKHCLGKLHGVHGTVGATNIVFHHLKHPGTTKALEHLGGVMFVTSLCQRQSRLESRQKYSASHVIARVSVKSGDTLQVRRSSKDIDISCNSAEHGDAQGRAISRANAGMAGNILFGGGIGAIIDHNKGAAYTYPSWVQLVFGQELTFDRSDEKDGLPVQDRGPATTAVK